MRRRAWIGAAAVVLLAGCGGSQRGPAAPTTASGQSPAATAPRTATTAAASINPGGRRKQPAAGAGADKRQHRSAAPRGTATATTPARPAPAPSKPHASAKRGSGGSQRAGAITIALVLHGGGNAAIQACGSEHHYRTYAVGTTVAFSGTVSPIPSGRWKVKLKVKVCSGGSYSPFAKLDALRDKHTGTFSGSFQAPAAGVYDARAVLYLAGSEAAKSNKRHFATR